MLKEAGFTGVALEPHEHSRELIAKWMPGSGAEDVVTAATIRATKPAQQC